MACENIVDFDPKMEKGKQEQAFCATPGHEEDTYMVAWGYWTQDGRSFR